MTHDTAFETATSAVRFGKGVTREVGMDLVDLGAHRVLVVTDPNLARLPPVATVLQSLDDNRVAFVLYDRVSIEPTDRSFREAIDAGTREPFDAIVAVGGGSTIDTAKAINLYVTYPPQDFRDYVNPPVGKGLPVPGPLQPLFAIPTTSGTGSETTGVCIFDDTRLRVKTGISSRRLKPTLGFLDPDNTRTSPPQVTASSGLDVLCHAVESYTTLPFTDRLRPDRPGQRPAYQGSNPISDMWSLEALKIVAQDPSYGPSTTPRMTTRARRCCWRPPTPAWVSGPRACTCRTPCRTLCRGTSRHTARPATQSTIHSCLTVCR